MDIVHRQGRLKRRKKMPPVFLMDSLTLPTLFLKVSIGQIPCICKLQQNVRSIKGEGFYFDFYLHLNFEHKWGSLT